MLAGSLFFQFGQAVIFGYNGRSEAGLPLRPNDLIQWQAIHEACRDGYRIYDLGDVADRQDGLARFKTKWGAVPRRLYRYHFPAPRGFESDPAQFDRLGARLARLGWRRLPLGATALAGSLIHRFLAA